MSELSKRLAEEEVQFIKEISIFWRDHKEERQYWVKNHSKEHIREYVKMKIPFDFTHHLFLIRMMILFKEWMETKES